jgi:5'-nucleotidase
MPRQRICTSALVMLLLAACGASGPPTGLTLALIHINDTHSHFDATTARLQGPEPEQTLYTFIGGHPRLLTMAQQRRLAAQSQGIPSLFLHGGDAFKGSAYFELFEHRINIDVLNRMGLDAMALGNHEFDIGLEKLAEFVDQVNFPVLAANVNTHSEPLLADSQNLKDYALFALRADSLQAVASLQDAGQNPVVAVFGLALEDMPGIAPGTGKLTFAGEVESAQATVDLLHAKGIRHVIALTHLGHQRDLRLASAVNGIDAIVGGHSHTLLGDFEHWFLGRQPPYAQMVRNPDGLGQTCVVQAGQFAQAIGSVQLQFNAAGELQSCVGENTLLASRDYFYSPLRDEQSRNDAALQQMLEIHVDSLPRTAVTDEHAGLRSLLDTRYLPEVQQAYGRRVASADDVIPHVRLPGTGGSDQHGSVLAGHISDGMHYWLNRPETRSVIDRRVDFTLIGAGNIRASLEAGSIYEGHLLLEVLPFDTPLSILTVSGAQLRALLEDVISATLPEGAHAGKFPYGSHLRYVAEETTEQLATLSQLQWLQHDTWQDIEADDNYVLATTSYLADGNDGWGLLAAIDQTRSQRVDVILQDERPVIYPLTALEPRVSGSGDITFSAQYAHGEELPCDSTATDCKVAARAVIEYLIANPAVINNNRLPTVTLIRSKH